MRRKRNVTVRPLMVVEGTGMSGNPTQLTEVAIERVEALARTGLRQISIAALLGIGEGAWDSAIEHQPEVDAAFRRGRASLEQELAGLLIARAREGNIAATIFGLKNVAQWSDGGIRGEAAPALNVNINIPPSMSEAEFRQIIDGR